MPADTAVRFAMRAAAADALDPAQVRCLVEADGRLRVLMETPRMLLVEGDIADGARALGQGSGWVLAAETRTPVPDPRPRLRAASRAG
jgi:hypothetical protein